MPGFLVVPSSPPPRALRSVCLTLVAALSAACGGGAPAETPAPAAKVVSSPVDPVTAGTITGTVTLAGKPPAPQPVNTSADPNCMAPITTEDVVVGKGSTLQNVFVYVKDGLGTLAFPVPATPAVLSQDGCMYRPRVLGMQVGQTLELLNGDDTLHNVHAVPMKNAEFNLGQPFKGFKHTRIFSTHEVLVPFKCDVHRWMVAYVGVVEHPFFAVTGTSGTFELKGLPPGTYTIEAVHEKLGTQTRTVTLEPKGAQDVAFSFKI